jgi:uncharacterized protein involved in exopolysaccharide biosynthesis
MNQLRGPSIQHAALNAERNGGGEFSLAPAAGQAPGAEQAFFQLDLKRSLQLHWKLARTVALGFVALSVLYVLAQVFWFRSWPTYMAVSTVYVKPTPAKILENGSPRWPADSNTYETYIQQQMMNVSREDVLADAVHKLDGFAAPGESDESASARLVRSLEVNRIGEAYQFTISARAGNAQAAADIANTVTAAYIDSASRDERAGDTQRLAALKEEKDRIQAALAADHTEQDELNKQLGVASVGTAVPDHYDEDITQIRTELAKARTDHDVAEQKFAALGAGHGLSSSAIDAQADEMIASDPGLVSMKQTLNTRRSTLISQMANMTPANPQYKADEAELVKINGTLDAMMKELRAKAAARIQLQLRSDLQRTGGVESQLNGQLRQLVGAATSATPKMQRSSDLAADITRLQSRYAAVDEQWHNVTLEDTAPAAAYQILPATPPLGRSKSGVMRNAILICIAGLFFAVLTAIAAHRFDPRVYVSADVERVLGFAPLALLPDFNEVSEAVAEEYMLRLSAAVEHGRKQGNLKNCIFTGTGSGTGVSTVVNRVGAMLEAMGRPTVRVDATGAQAPLPPPPTPASQFGLVPVQKSIRSSALLQKMAEETENEEDSLILTDTAPLVVSAETEYLARYVDCAIVVLESGVTTRTELREAASILQKLGVGAVGFVLNRIGLAKADPAFRSSVEAVEKHLQAQANQPARRTERPASIPPDSKPAWEAAFPKAAPSHPMFEPEMAAAAAAVARFSAHPVAAPASTPAPDSAVCLPSPLVSPPVAEAAKRFSMPLVSGSIEEPAKPAATPAAAPDLSALPVVQPEPSSVPAPVEQTTIAHHAEIPAATPASSPFAEAAQRVLSHRTSAPAISLSPRPAPVVAAADYSSAEPETLAPDPPAEVVSSPAEVSSALPPENVEPAAALVNEPTLVHQDSAPEEKAVEEKPVPENPVLEHLAQEKPVPDKPVVQPSSDTSDDIPWWLSETPRNAEPPRAAVLWQPAKVSTAHAHDNQPEPAAAASTNAGSPQSLPIAQTPNSPGDATSSSHVDAPDPRTSRLSGLRNLLFVLGVKDIQNAAGPNDPQSGAGTLFDRRPERQIFERTIAESDADRAVGGASPRLVTAPPEFLPPKVVEFNKIDPHVGESQTRQDRRATSDGVDILPSRHGQYKKV